MSEGNHRFLIADVCTKAHKLDPSDSQDRNEDADKNGYTNLEECLNGLVKHE
jgi:hypothetical protein